ncbi:aminomethyltransferase, mitochondrial [[Candida] railenensis]|uniref:Aminomethyltransferase n=1 Tax=[Candida] railenensis TaxID=45579 RepID=A0A9P0QMU1_9ASCO|nr:aminomethyltransferase, mitochondrial [[Candida] railenensis]
MLRSISLISKRSNSSSSAALLKTPLYESHLALGGKMVPYAGFEMPVLYKDQSHIQSHNWVRANCGLFDVSHMLQHNFSGPSAKALLEKITPIDLASLPVNSSSLTVLLNNEGGIIDDCIITKHGEEQFYMVTNAGCREKDVKFIKQEISSLQGDLNHNTFEGTLLAVQGPKSKEILQKFVSDFDLNKLTFGQTKFNKFNSIIDSEVHIARSGYTGEDGFELSIASSNDVETKQAQDFFNLLISEYPEVVKPIGLAARDSLRLEAGMCLYGYELNESITPIEASLAWLIPKARRTPDLATFNGSSKILSQLSDRSLVSHQRVGITSKGPAPRDSSSKIFDKSGAEIGYITSGSPSPTLGGNVAQGYVKRGSHKSGTEIDIEIRGKKRPGVISKMPFVPNNFFRG